MKILHILYQSLPQISGSSIRSRDILMAQKEIGLDIIAATSPFQKANSKEEYYNEIKYYRTKIGNTDSISDNTKSFFKRVTRLFKIISFTRELNKVIFLEEPQILHAHAMFFCGIPALILGNKYNLPVVYEVRSLWMLSKTNKKKGFFKNQIEKILFKLELLVMAKADVVIAINENLKQVLIQGGIIDKKIHVVKNAVNTTLIKELKQKIKSKSDTNGLNFGYIGTLTPHEGIDLLIHSFSEVNRKYPDTKLLIYGTGIEKDKIDKLSKMYNNVYFLGSVEPSKIEEAFHSIDIIVNPRYKNKLTDSVTPLKPLEAMAYEKLVVGSDVGGIQELISHASNGVLFKAGDKESLVKIMLEVIEMESGERNMIKDTAYRFVVNEKSWISNARQYKIIYNTLLS